jgi:hypothetical protein
VKDLKPLRKNHSTKIAKTEITTTKVLKKIENFRPEKKLKNEKTIPHGRTTNDKKTAIAELRIHAKCFTSSDKKELKTTAL